MNIADQAAVPETGSTEIPSGAMREEGRDFTIIVNAEGRLISATRGWHECFGGWWFWPVGATWDDVTCLPGADAAWRAWREMLSLCGSTRSGRNTVADWTGPRGASLRIALKLQPLRNGGPRDGVMVNGRVLSRVDGGDAENPTGWSAMPSLSGDPPREFAWLQVCAKPLPGGPTFALESVSSVAREWIPAGAVMRGYTEFPGPDQPAMRTKLLPAMRRTLETGEPSVAMISVSGDDALHPTTRQLEAQVTRFGSDRIQIRLQDRSAALENLRQLMVYGRRLEHLLVHGSELQLTLNLDGGVTEVGNVPAGCDPRGFLQRPLWECFAVEQREAIQVALAQAWSNDEPITMECRTVEGGERWFQLCLCALPLGRTEQTYVVTGVETTERRRAVQVGQWLALLEKQAGAAVIEVSFEGRVTAWSRGAEALVGLPAEQAFGRPVWTWLGSEDQAVQVAAQERARRGESSPAAAIRWLRSDGEPVAMDVTVIPRRNGEGQVEGTCWTMHETSARRSLEEQLRHGRQLAAMGSLAAMSAHDLKNCLGIALGHIQLFQGAEPAHAGAFEPALRALRMASRFCEQFCEFTLPAGPEAEVPLDLAEAVARTCGMFERVIERRLRLELPAPGTCRLPVSSFQIDQILVNLLLNARDATAPIAGEITVRVSEAPRRDGGPAGLQLEVSDNGAGMSPETAARLTEAYFTTKPRGQGTGLGLAGVMRTVRQLGGSMHFTSAPDRGTTVLVLLPPAPDPDDAPVV
jgi:PAS domain S-box-containing protein